MTAAVLGIAAVAVVTLQGREHSGPVAPPAGMAAAPSVPIVSPAAAPSTERQRPATSGGGAILASSLRAQAVVTGVVSRVQSIDVHGWRADLGIDRVLLGKLGLGDTVTIGWEELSAARQVRFADDQRVLVVLDALPTQSLWRKRFPADERTRAVMVVASAGDAFLVRPDGVTLDALEHYLAMTSEARTGAPGAERLAELVRGGHPAVASEALALLEAEPGRADLLGEDGAATLLAAARSPERAPALRGAALRLAARHRLPGTRETALALIEPGSSIRADAYRALAALPEGLSAERVEGLLGDADPAVRAAGLEVAGDQIARESLERISREDASPAVRLTAGQALLARFRGSGIAAVIALLDDPDPVVRNGIAESIGALGTEAVAPLRAVVDGQSERAAVAAVRGLAHAGREGAAALASIAERHQNKSVRTFAGLALGNAPGHTH